MIRTLKQLGSALVISLILILSLAGTAAAEFEAEPEAEWLSVSANSLISVSFKAGEKGVSCTTLHLWGAHAEGPSWQTLTAEPIFTNCHTFFGANVVRDTNGCQWVFHLEASQTSGTMDVECPTEQGLRFTAGSICTHQVDTQTGLNSVTYKNLGSGATREIEVTMNVTGVLTTRTTNHFFCPPGSTEGTITGSFRLTAQAEGGGHRGVFVD